LSDDLGRLGKMAKYTFGNVLDVGCSHISNPYLKHAVGFDIVQPRELPQNYSRFVQGDAENLDRFFPEESFDSIIAGELIEHLENPYAFLRGCKKVLKPSGLLILSTPTPFYWKTIIGDLFF
jgi:SAM-dependent methyltransferase